MNKVLIGLLGFGVMLGAGAFFLQRATNAELHSEIAALRDEVQQLAKLRAGARPAEERPAGTILAPAEARVGDEQRAELAKLRDEVADLKKSTRETARQAQAATQAARGESPVPVNLRAIAELKNVGRATLPAAVETLLAAAFGGDVDTVASSIVFAPTAEGLAQELFARLPEATRAQYGSPEKLIALMVAKDAASLAGMQILGQRDVSPDVVGVRVRLSNEEGKTKEQSYGFRKTSDGLRMIITDEVVEKYAGQLSGKK